MVCDKPRVSIGMPVFNGEKYLKEVLDSILAQTYQDFELIISDNASTDNTSQICRAYAAKDNRVRYYRNKRNLGAARNFNRVFELSSGEYFKWAAYDDVLAPEFLSKCVSLLDEDPTVVLCQTRISLIDKDGRRVGNLDPGTRIDSQKPHERFGDVISKKVSYWMIFGLTRASALRLSPLMGNYIGADKNLLADLCLIGGIYTIPEYLFFQRDHLESYTRDYCIRGFRDYRNELTWWTGNDKRAGWIILPHWKNCVEYFKSVRRAPLKLSEKLLCYEQIARWLVEEGWRLIRWDLANELKRWRIQLNCEQAKERELLKNMGEMGRKIVVERWKR